MIACQGGSLGSKVILLVTDGVLGLGRDVVDDGGEEVGGFEYFEIPFGGVVAL